MLTRPIFLMPRKEFKKRGACSTCDIPIGIGRDMWQRRI